MKTRLSAAALLIFTTSHFSALASQTQQEAQQAEDAVKELGKILQNKEASEAIGKALGIPEEAVRSRGEKMENDPAGQLEKAEKGLADAAEQQNNDESNQSSDDSNNSSDDGNSGDDSENSSDDGNSSDDSGNNSDDDSSDDSNNSSDDDNSGDESENNSDDE